MSHRLSGVTIRNCFLLHICWSLLLIFNQSVIHNCALLQANGPVTAKTRFSWSSKMVPKSGNSWVLLQRLFPFNGPALCQWIQRWTKESSCRLELTFNQRTQWETTVFNQLSQSFESDAIIFFLALRRKTNNLSSIAFSEGLLDLRFLSTSDGY